MKCYIVSCSGNEIDLGHLKGKSVVLSQSSLEGLCCLLFMLCLTNQHTYMIIYDEDNRVTVDPELVAAKCLMKVKQTDSRILTDLLLMANNFRHCRHYAIMGYCNHYFLFQYDNKEFLKGSELACEILNRNFKTILIKRDVKRRVIRRDSLIKSDSEEISMPIDLRMTESNPS